jgi:hypothetical protein
MPQPPTVTPTLEVLSTATVPRPPIPMPLLLSQYPAFFQWRRPYFGIQPARREYKNRWPGRRYRRMCTYRYRWQDSYFPFRGGDLESWCNRSACIGTRSALSPKDPVSNEKPATEPTACLTRRASTTSLESSLAGKATLRLINDALRVSPPR